jgi:NADPH:quinone reductase-like Zn-dependent oxidoreductase
MLTALAEPELLEGEVLVKIKAAGVNPIDLKLRQGSLRRLLPYRFPFIPGWDMAGVVAHTGYGVKRLKPGDEVYACCRRPVLQYGTYAEYIALPESYVTLRPASVSFCEAAALPLAGLAAWQALFEKGRLKEGDNLLILGAAGGAGSLAVQYARLTGVWVCALARPEQHTYLYGLGADAVIDDRETDFRIRCRQLLPRGADLIFDCVGGDVLARAYDCAKPGGTVVSLLEQVGDIRQLKEKRLNYYYLTVEPNVLQLDEIRRLVESAQLHIALQTVYPLADAARAHDRLAAGHGRGRIVLEI